MPFRGLLQLELQQLEKKVVDSSSSSMRGLRESEPVGACFSSLCIVQLMYYVAHIQPFVLYKLKQLFNLQLFIICLLLIKHLFSWPLNKSYKKMLNQSKIKYILASSVLFLLLFVTQYTPKKSMFFNKLENQINIINTFPDINPEKCLRSSKFFGGNSN